MEQTKKIIERINSCFLPKLSKNYDEKENHMEYDIRNKNLPSNFHLLIEALNNLDLQKIENDSLIISSLLNLNSELNCNCSWNDTKSQDYSKNLNIYFEHSYKVKLDNILYQNEIFNRNKIFYYLLQTLHNKLTVEEFKKFPGQIEVYCSLIKNVKEYNIILKLQQVMPACLILLDDYIITNKIKGLKCCLSILKCLTTTDFKEGNYYEVIYRSLNNTLLEKDIEVTKLTHLCLLELCNILPSDVKPIKLEDMYSNILDQLYTESNLYRKAECLEFTKQIIKMHKDNCIGNTSFNLIISDNLEICTNNAVIEILLEKTLQCLEEWIKYCWSIWKLPSNHNIISKLLKVLYVCKDEDMSKYIQKITVTLIQLCSVEEQKQIYYDLDDCIQKECINGCYMERLKQIQIDWIYIK